MVSPNVLNTHYTRWFGQNLKHFLRCCNSESKSARKLKFRRLAVLVMIHTCAKNQANQGGHVSQVCQLLLTFSQSVPQSLFVNWPKILRWNATKPRSFRKGKEGISKCLGKRRWIYISLHLKWLLRMLSNWYFTTSKVNRYCAYKWRCHQSILISDTHSKIFLSWKTLAILMKFSFLILLILMIISWIFS